MGHRWALFALLSAIAIAVVFHPVAAQNASSAGDPASAVNSSTSPDDWFDSVKQSNWEVSDTISGEMEQILSQALIDFGSYHPNGRCNEAAAMQAWQALADAANGGPLEGFLDAIKGAFKGIFKVATFGADPEEGAAAIEAGKLSEQAFEQAKDHGTDWLKEKLKEIWKGKPVEVLKRTTQRGPCKIVLVAIWDRGAQRYEITIYGECNCAPVSTWNGGPSAALKTFAVRLTGSVVPSREGDDHVYTVGLAKITTFANCGCTAETGTSGATPSPAPSAPAVTQKMPNSGDGWRKLTTPCPKCQGIVDKIHAAQDARDAMDSEFRTTMTQLESAKGRHDQADIDTYTAAMNALTAREAGLIQLQQRLFKELLDCQATCGFGANFTPVVPTPGNTASEGHAYLPKVAGPGSSIVATFVDPAQSGPSDVLVTLFTDDGQQHSYRTRTQSDHHLAFAIPTLLAGVLVKEVFLSQGFDDRGRPDPAAARMEVSSDAVVPNTDAIGPPPSTRVAIVRGSSAYERAPGRGIVDLQVRGVDPSDATLEIDGSTVGISTRAVSNESIEGELDPGVAEGRHVITVLSGGGSSNPMPADVVTLIPHPLPPSEPGTVETLVIECHGLGSDPATMAIAVSGAATLASGGDQTTVPVVDGVAQVQIRGVRAGAAIARFRLHVRIPGYW